MKHARHPRGFTLLELIIAVAMGIAILTATVAVLLVVASEGKRSRAHAELMRDATFLAQTLQLDLRQAGLGVPTGSHIMQDCSPDGTTCTAQFGTGGAARFSSRRISFAGTSAVGIVADLPRPDGNWPAFGPLYSRPAGGAANGIMWSTENNGTCVPNSAATCAIQQTSLFFPNDGVAERCASGVSADVRTCPWALRRVLAGDRLQIVDGGGNWSHTARGAGVANFALPGGGTAIGIQVGPAFDLGQLNGQVEDRVWGSGGAPTNNDAPWAIPGTGWVTTIDRSFFQLSGTTVTRIQCFGDPDPQNASWPAPGAASVPGIAALRLTPAIAGTSVTTEANTCIGPEVVARHVAAFSLSYDVDDDGNGIADRTVASTTAAGELATIVAVRYSATLSLLPQGFAAPVVYDVSGRVQLQN